MKPLILALCLSSPAYASDTASWGDGTAILQCDPPNATVTVTNWLGGSQDRIWALLTCPGLQVGLEVTHGRGKVPDHVRIVPPFGFMAIPADATVEEDGSREFLIVPISEAMS